MKTLKYAMFYVVCGDTYRKNKMNERRVINRKCKNNYISCRTMLWINRKRLEETVK